MMAGVGAGVRVRRAVGVALEGDGGHGDGRKAGEPPIVGLTPVCWNRWSVAFTGTSWECGLTLCLLSTVALGAVRSRQ
jgi:hypothetical protein